MTTKHERSLWAARDKRISAPPVRVYGKTDHAVARAYAAKGWLPFKSREDWQDSLRYRGTFR